jgi:predicted ATP-grasp superfamily ATP-dependent carboligase
MQVLAVAGMSARAMAEAAARDGFDPVALDLFGDIDTCRAASRWLPIGEPGSLHIDDAMTLSALRVLAQRGDVLGWVAGGGFEGRPELLASGAALLPLVGMAPGAVRRVRDPAFFFDVLGSFGIAHPEVSFAAPQDAAGWLVKDAQGCGGWQVRPAPMHSTEPLPMHQYFQRVVRGVPMSATFVACGGQAVVLGFNEQIVQRFGDRPYVFCGVIGPVPLPPEAAVQVREAVVALAGQFALQGLCSLDFMLDGSRIAVLELNPRPPASIVLYGDLAPIDAHVRACLHGELPPVPVPPLRVEGQRVVFARQPLQLTDRLAQCLADWPEAHDLPCAGMAVATGDPLCSLTASGIDAAQVRARLQQGHDRLLKTLENLA